MSTRCTTPQACGGRVDEVGDLVGAERDGEVGADVRPLETAGVHVDPGRYVDRDHGRVREPRDHPFGVGAQAGPATDPDDPVQHDVGRRGLVRGHHPASGGAQRGHALVVGLVGEQHRLDAGPAPRQQRPGVQRVAAVVPRTHEQQHPGAVHTAEQVRHRDRQPRRRPLHQRALRHPRHQPGLRRPHLLHRVCLPHPPDAIPPTGRRCTPSRRAVGDVRPGAPSGHRRTAYVHDRWARSRRTSQTAGRDLAVRS